MKFKNKKVVKALRFATKKHEGQLRKYTGEPYINHPIAVARIVMTVTDDKDMICAALLHDTVEDTETNLEEIKDNFGSRVEMLVEGLTDVSKPEDGNRVIRKEIDRNHTGNSCADVKTIKLADLIHNTGSITKYDENFSKVYMKEKSLLLPLLKQGNEKLHKKASLLVDRYFSLN